MLKRLLYRIVGEPPSSAASTEDRLRWTRKLYRLNVAAVAIVVVFALFTGSLFLWILAAAGALACTAGVASITRSIRRAHVGRE